MHLQKIIEPLVNDMAKLNTVNVTVNGGVRNGSVFCGTVDKFSKSRLGDLTCRFISSICTGLQKCFDWLLSKSVLMFFFFGTIHIDRNFHIPSKSFLRDTNKQNAFSRTSKV